MTTVGDSRHLSGQEPTVAYVRKPIKPQNLYDALVRLLTQMPGNLPAATPARWDLTLGERQPLHVLMAEDNPVNQKVMRGMLQRSGYQCHRGQ